MFGPADWGRDFGAGWETVAAVVVSCLRMSIGIAVPVSPRNWDSADVRYVRAVTASRDAVCLLAAGVDVDECVTLDIRQWLNPHLSPEKL